MSWIFDIVLRWLMRLRLWLEDVAENELEAVEARAAPDDVVLFGGPWGIDSRVVYA